MTVVNTEVGHIVEKVDNLRVGILRTLSLERLQKNNGGRNFNSVDVTESFQSKLVGDKYVIKCINQNMCPGKTRKTALSPSDDKRCYLN